MIIKCPSPDAAKQQKKKKYDAADVGAQWPFFSNKALYIFAKEFSFYLVFTSKIYIFRQVLILKYLKQFQFSIHQYQLNFLARSSLLQ